MQERGRKGPKAHSRGNLGEGGRQRRRRRRKREDSASAEADKEEGIRDRLS